MEKKRVLLIVLLLVIIAAAITVSMAVISLMQGSSKVEEVNTASDGDAVTVRSDVLPTRKPSSTPTFFPSRFPVMDPTLTPTIFRTSTPSQNPTPVTTVEPTTLPTMASPSSMPVSQWSETPSSHAPTAKVCSPFDVSPECTTTNLYVIADVPYTDEDRLALPQQILTIPSDAEFLVHLGDIRTANKGDRCELNEYQAVKATFRLSKVPVFLVLGDNEWNDCANIDEGMEYWEKEFSAFENNWNHDFRVVRPANRMENFAFVHKRTLFIGLNIVGGAVHNETEWIERLTEEATWTTNYIRAHTGGSLVVEQVFSVVIFGHAHPTAIHNYFFVPLKQFIKDELNDAIPLLYLNGDGHEWEYQPKFLGESQVLRVQLTGGTSEPPLQLVVASTNNLNLSRNPENVFLYDRQL